MSCGIICKRAIDFEPWPEVHADSCFNEPEPDAIDRWLGLFMGVACIIFGVATLSILAYGIISTIVAAVS